MPEGAEDSTPGRVDCWVRGYPFFTSPHPCPPLPPSPPNRLLQLVDQVDKGPDNEAEVARLHRDFLREAAQTELHVSTQGYDKAYSGESCGRGGDA